MIWPQLILWVVSFLLTDYFRERLPSQTPSGIGDFNIPTATEGRPVPIITGGTVRCDAPNCIWYGNFVAVERTTTTGIVFKRDEVIGYTYELAMQYALFKGESVGITGIWIGDEQVFNHVDDAGGIPQEFVDVDRDDLFGGKDQGGGFQGRVRLHKGAEGQAVSSYLDAQPELDPLPAYRGLSYIVITNLATQVLNGWLIEDVPAETKGANFGEANQIRYVRVEVQTFDDLAGTAGSPGLGDTLNLANDHHFIGPDLNPIVVAWDLWTNTRWGRGFGLADVNLANFQAAAEICWAEGLGWTNLIDEQTTTGSIQDLIEQHVDGYIGPNPLTGQIEVSLARPDYTIPSLPLVNDDNLIEVKEWSQGDWSNTKNRIRIRYTSRSKNWKETHAVETAAGNRIIQGRTVTEEVRFEGCHTDAVAQVIAARAKRGLSIPLQKGTIVVDRTGYTFKPGQPFRLTSDQTKTTDLPVRVTRIAYGDTVRQSIELSVVEDIFGNEPSTVEENPPSDFVPPVQTMIPFTADSQAALEPSFHLMQYDGLPGVTGRVATMARRNLGNRPTEYATLQRNSAGVPAGAYTSLVPNIVAGFCAVGTLRNAEIAGQAGQGTLTIQIDPFTGESLDALIGAYDPRFDDPKGIAIISPGLADEEFIIFRDIVDDGAGIRLESVYRSASDTPWKSHAIGAGVWFIWTGGFGMNETQTYALARNVEIKLLPISPNDALLEASATALPIVSMDTATGDRTTKPLVPVELQIPDGDVFPTAVDMDELIVPQSGPNYVGTQVVPLHRLAANPDIQDSVQGFTLAGIPALAADFADQNLDVSLWIYDIDQSTTRADALFSVLNQAVVNPNDEIQIEKADLVAGGAVGFGFNARIEIETRDSRPSSPALNISHEPLFHDFLAFGVFSVLPADQLFISHFDGLDAATAADDRSPQNQFIEFVGAAELDTAQSVYGGSSLLLDGVDSFIRVPMDRRFDVESAFTLELRVRFTVDPAGSVIMGGQFDGSGVRSWVVIYAGAIDHFQVAYSTTGSNGPTFVQISNSTFAPTPGTWYALAFVKTANDRWRIFIDGVQLGTETIVSAVMFRSTQDLLIGAWNDTGTPANFIDANIDEVRLTPRALYEEGASYTPGHPDFPLQDFDDSGENTPFLCHFEGADTDTTIQSDDLNDWTLNFGGTTEIDTAQSVFGSSSLRCDGVDSGTAELSDGAWIENTKASAAGGRRRTAFDLKRRDWTMDMRVRFITLPDNEGSALFGKYARGLSAGLDWYWSIEGSLVMSFNKSITGAISSQMVANSPVLTIVVDTWYHFAVERFGDDLSMYQDGVRVAQFVDWFLSPNDLMLNDDGPSAGGAFKNNPVSVGQMYQPNTSTRHRAMDGFIDEARIVYGAEYQGAASFTVPTVPYVDPKRVIADPADRPPVIILDHFEEAGVFTQDWIHREESSIGARLGFAGSGRITTGNFKFGSTSFESFGSADQGFYMKSRVNHYLGDLDFTLDVWANHDVLPHLDGNGGHALVSQWNGSSNERSFALYLDDQGGGGTTTDLVFAWSVDGTVVKRAFVTNVNASIAINTWIHYQVTRDGSTIRLWIDGVEQTLDGASDSIGADVLDEGEQAIYLGYMNGNAPDTRDFDGNMDELRLILGATPAGNFTPPTAPYPDPDLVYY